VSKTSRANFGPKRLNDVNTRCSTLRPDREVEGRYVTWSRLTEDGRLIRGIFEVQKINGERVVVVTAFREG
jgi:hypothetical protein